MNDKFSPIMLSSTPNLLDYNLHLDESCIFLNQKLGYYVRQQLRFN